MTFERVHIPGIPVAYAAFSGKWQFMIIQEQTGWTTSYRLKNPTGTVSASSTIMGPFDEFIGAEYAAQQKLSELRRLS